MLAVFNCPCQILAVHLLQAVLPSWDKTERARDMECLVEKLFGFLGRLLTTCSSDVPFLRGGQLSPLPVSWVSEQGVMRPSFACFLQNPHWGGGGPGRRPPWLPHTAARWRRRWWRCSAPCTPWASGTDSSTSTSTRSCTPSPPAARESRQRGWVPHCLFTAASFSL